MIWFALGTGYGIVLCIAWHLGQRYMRQIQLERGAIAKCSSCGHASAAAFYTNKTNRRWGNPPGSGLQEHSN